MASRAGSDPSASGLAGTIVCPSCGAAVRKTAGACGYCGAEVVLPKPVGATGPAERRTFCTRCGQLYPADASRCPRCPPTSSEEPGHRCPRCAGDLETLPVVSGRPVVIDRCRACQGLWFDGDEVEHAIDVTTKGVSRDEAIGLRPAIPASTIPVEEIRYLACVRCGERMARRQVAPRAGIVVDICRLHGVWFDAGEFEQFTQFVRAGGLEVARHDGIAAAEAKERAERETRVGAASLDELFIGPPPLRGDPRIRGYGLGYAILRAIESLFRSRG